MKILMVEGSDDAHVLRRICCYRGITDLGEVKSYGGYEGVRESIRNRVTGTDEGDIVGVVIDADSDLPARWQSIRQKIMEVGYTGVPMDPVPEGTILDPSGNPILPRLGIWIMPDNKTPGILEDFLRFLIPQRDSLLKHARTSLYSLPEQMFTDLDKPKALIHTWLAWQKEPGRPYGTAITAKFLDPCLPQADILASWLKRLFT